MNRDDVFTRTEVDAGRWERAHTEDDERVPEWDDTPAASHICNDACREMCASFDTVLDAIKRRWKK